MEKRIKYLYILPGQLKRAIVINTENVMMIINAIETKIEDCIIWGFDLLAILLPQKTDNKIGIIVLPRSTAMKTNHDPKYSCQSACARLIVANNKGL